MSALGHKRTWPHIRSMSALQQEIRCVDSDFSCRSLEFERGKRLLRNLWRLYKNTLRSTSHLYATTITFTRRDSRCLIMRSEYDFESAVEENEDDAAWSKSPEEFIDRFGIRTALFVLCIASFLAAIWLVNRPSFEKCSGLENVTERNACIETLRNDLMKPPAKGADIPRG